MESDPSESSTRQSGDLGGKACEFIEQHGLLRIICICVYIYAAKVLAHETWNTKASHRDAFVQQKSPPTYKELISYGSSS